MNEVPPPVDIRPTKFPHRTEPCTLPRKRRRWIGLVAACPICDKLYALVENDNGFTYWEELRGTR